LAVASGRQKVRLNGQPYEVIGVLASKVERLMNQDDQVFILSPP
jgi:hypothetical protein